MAVGESLDLLRQGFLTVNCSYSRIHAKGNQEDEEKAKLAFGTVLKHPQSTEIIVIPTGAISHCQPICHLISSKIPSLRGHTIDFIIVFFLGGVEDTKRQIKLKCLDQLKETSCFGTLNYMSQGWKEAILI